MRLSGPQEFTPTTPIGYINLAEAYRVGAQLLAKELNGVGGWAGQPTRYLYYHCIELYLKAALIAAGLTEPQLKNIGHGFQRMGAAANAKGLGLDEPGDLAVLAMIDAEENYIRARYHQVGYFTVATIQALDSTAYELATVTVQLVRKADVKVRAPRPALPHEFRFQIG